MSNHFYFDQRLLDEPIALTSLNKITPSVISGRYYDIILSLRILSDRIVRSYNSVDTRILSLEFLA